jgi:DnaJ like chaperone protein
MTILLNRIVDGVKVNEEPNIFGIIFTVVFLAIPFFLTVVLIYQRIQASKWKKGLFPQNLKYTSDNLLKAYISLSGLLIRINPEESNSKFYYSVGYFNKKFPNSDLDFKFLLRFSLRYPIKSNMVCNWINVHLTKDVYKLQIIYFLTGLAMVDGSIKGVEYKLLVNLVHRLGLKYSDFQSIVAMYLKSANREHVDTEKYTPKVDYEKKKSLKILGLKDGVSVEEIKKAYRILVMKYHPDKFEMEGTDQVEIAKNRFIIIQKAYEYLEVNY